MSCLKLRSFCHAFCAICAIVQFLYEILNSTKWVKHSANQLLASLI